MAATVSCATALLGVYVMSSATSINEQWQHACGSQHNLHYKLAVWLTFVVTHRLTAPMCGTALPVFLPHPQLEVATTAGRYCHMCSGMICQACDGATSECKHML